MNASLCVDDAVLASWLREDAPFGDLTSAALVPPGAQGGMHFAARGAMRVACSEEAVRLIELAGARATLVAPSGTAVEAGAPLLEAEGPAHALLLAWKVAQTLMEGAGGIATATAAIVGALRAAGFATPLACTRKTMPGTRAVAAKAVRAGGGVMHRLGLSETLLVFPEHRAFASPDWAALRAAQPEKRVVAEVGSAEEALACARAGVDVLQLERFAPEALAALREALRGEGLAPKVAPAGGVTLANAVAYAAAGADFLVSSAPYFAPPTDIRVTIAARPAPRARTRGLSHRP